MSDDSRDWSAEEELAYAAHYEEVPMTNHTRATAWPFASGERPDLYVVGIITPTRAGSLPCLGLRAELRMAVDGAREREGTEWSVTP